MTCKDCKYFKRNYCTFHDDDVYRYDPACDNFKRNYFADDDDDDRNPYEDPCTGDDPYVF